MESIHRWMMDSIIALSGGNITQVINVSHMWNLHFLVVAIQEQVKLILMMYSIQPNILII